MLPLAMHEEVVGKYQGDSIDNPRFAIEHMDEAPPGVSVVGVDGRTGRRTFFDPDTVAKDFVASKETLHLTFSQLPRSR